MNKQKSILIIGVCLIFSAVLVLNAMWQNHEQDISSKIEYPYLIADTNPAVPIRVNEMPFLKQPMSIDNNVVEILRRR